MLVESGNPAHSLADSQLMREALSALDLLVVIDVAMTETARLAHYVLPVPSQFEKWEATFFNFDFPRNVFHLRRPLLEPLPGTLGEPEIHARLCEAMGGFGEDDVAPLRAAAEESRGAFADAFFAALAAKPQLGRFAPNLLYRALGPTLPDGAAAAAALWGAAHRCAQENPASVAQAGFSGEGLEPGERLFDAILASPSGLVFSVDDPDVGLARLRTDDGKAHLAIAELLEELDRLAVEVAPGGSDEFPFVLSAGERRSFTANTIFRDPAWRKRDSAGSLRISPSDAEGLSVADGDLVRVTTKRGTVVAPVEVNEIMQPGHVSLPNGLGVDYPSEDGSVAATGAAPNELTASEDRDWIAGTPWHKHVPARLERVESRLDAPAIASA
jgi:formate dehydrogenase